MQLDAILEVAIGLVFVWLVISVATLEVQNRIGTMLNWRADYLEKSVLSMLKKPELVKKFYEHPLILELAQKDKNGNVIKNKRGEIRKPDYIPNATFATAAFEVIMNAGKDGKITPISGMSAQQMKESMQELWAKNELLASVAQYLYPNMERDMARLENDFDGFEQKIAEYRRNTEAWFNDVMTQTSSWYKIRAQWIAFWIGLAIAVIFNVDTIYVAQKLWQEPTARAILVAQAQAEASQDAPATQLNNIAFPVGWTTTRLETSSCRNLGIIENQIVFRSADECRALTGLPKLNNGWGMVVKIFGYLLSAFAAAQGAPFWFDILRKMVGLKQPAKS